MNITFVDILYSIVILFYRLEIILGEGLIEMVVIRVGELMARNKMNQSQLAEATKIRKNTISDLWHGKTKRIDIEHINALCKALNCTPGDIFEYIPD